MGRFAIILLTVTLLPTVGWSQYVIFHQGNNGTNTIVIPQGEVWQLVNYAFDTSDPGNNSIAIHQGTNPSNPNRLFALSYQYGAIQSSVAAPINGAGVPFPGPMCVVISPGITNYHLVFKKASSSSDPAVGNTSVVIPSSSAGDVEIKIEQSADKVTWQECQPGTYSSSTVQRFFRLRAVEK